jgi:TonB family protein
MRSILAVSALLSTLSFSAAAFATQPVTDEPASTSIRSVSTGVIPAHVVSTQDVDLSPAAAETLAYNAEVVLTLNVDAKGNAQNVQVIKSPSRYLDGPVAAAVRQYHFRPATLDNQPIATPVTLTVVVQR